MRPDTLYKLRLWLISHKTRMRRVSATPAWSRYLRDLSSGDSVDVREVVHEVAEQDAVDVRRGPRVRPDVEFSEPVGITEQKISK